MLPSIYSTLPTRRTAADAWSRYWAGAGHATGVVAGFVCPRLSRARPCAARVHAGCAPIGLLAAIHDLHHSAGGQHKLVLVRNCGERLDVLGVERLDAEQRARTARARPRAPLLERVRAAMRERERERRHTSRKHGVASAARRRRGRRAVAWVTSPLLPRNSGRCSTSMLEVHEEKAHMILIAPLG